MLGVYEWRDGGVGADTWLYEELADDVGGSEAGSGDMAAPVTFSSVTAGPKLKGVAPGGRTIRSLRKACVRFRRW